MSFEQNLQNSMFSAQSEKTFIDKILAKQDVDAIRDIIKKPKLERSDMLELLYLLSGVESKLLNYGEWDRYIILKFFVWIREFVKIAEMLYDYQDDLRKRELLCANCGHYKDDKIKPCKCGKFKPSFKLSARTKKLIYNNERMIEHNAKFLIDLYFNIGRTTLSIGATGIMEILKNKYEISYPQQAFMATQMQQDQKPNIFGMKK